MLFCEEEEDAVLSLEDRGVQGLFDVDDDDFLPTLLFLFHSMEMR